MSISQRERRGEGGRKERAKGGEELEGGEGVA